jgi:hypothetical protein
MIDLTSDFIQAMRTPEVQSALAEAVARPIVAQILSALESREAAGYLDSAQLAQRLGITTRALNARLRRGSDLAAIARSLDGKRVWLRQDLEALIASRPRLCAARRGAAR